MNFVPFRVSMKNSAQRPLIEEIGYSLLIDHHRFHASNVDHRNRMPLLLQPNLLLLLALKSPFPSGNCQCQFANTNSGCQLECLKMEEIFVKEMETNIAHSGPHQNLAFLRFQLLLWQTRFGVNWWKPPLNRE
jgi:hypothetical protein